MRWNHSHRRTAPLGVTRLEDRTQPASSITVVNQASGGSLDGFLSDATPGVISAADGGATPGTLSTGALAAVGSNTNISVTCNNGITFNDLGGTLTLQTGAGRSVTFNSGAGSLSFANTNNTLATSGGRINLTAGLSLSGGNLNSGGGDVGLTAGVVSPGTIAIRSIQGGTGNISMQTSLGSASSGAITLTSSVVGQAVTISAAGSVAVSTLQGTNVSITSDVGGIGATVIQNTGQLTLSAATGITVIGTSAVSIQATNSTSGIINIKQLATSAQALTTTGTGVRNQAVGAAVVLHNDGGAITVAEGSPVQTSNGTISFDALDFNLAGAVNSGTARTTLANSTDGRQIDLGGNTAGRIGLTQAELNNITAGVLHVGSFTAGLMQVTAAIGPLTGTSTLALFSNSAINSSGGATITVPNLRLSSAGVSLANANSVGTLVSSSSAGTFSFRNSTPLVIGTVDGVTGITNTGSNAFLNADVLDVQQAINVGTNLVMLLPSTTGRPISFGAEVAGQLSLTDTEVGRVAAGILRVGAPIAGSISVNGAITRHAGYNELWLESSGNISQSAALSAANLLVRASGAVSLTNSANNADTLAGSAGSGGFSYTDANALTLVTNDSTAGITTIGPVTLTTGGSITDGNGTATNVQGTSFIVNGATSVNLDTDVDTLSFNLSLPGGVQLTEAGTATINSFNLGPGAIVLDGGTFDLGGNNVIAGGSLTMMGATLNMGAFSNQALVNVLLASGSIIGTGTLSVVGTHEVRSGTISARLGGNTVLTKASTGTVTFSGANAYTGTTTINGGTLLINGSQAAGSGVTVNSGGTLGGTGTIPGIVTVNGGTLAPGSSPGVLNTGTLQFTVGSTFSAEVNSPYATAGTDYDRVNVTGSVDLNAATLSLVGGAVAPPAGTVLTIISNDGTDPVSGTFAGLPQGGTVTVGSFVATISYTGGDGNDVTLTTANPPVITGHPANQTVGEGSPVTFTASASGVPTPTVQWQVSTNGGGLFIDIPGATSTSLTFNAALGQNGHQFRAVFTNPAGTATGNTATLTVIAKPTAFALTLDVPRDTPRPLTLSGFDPNGRPLTFTVTAPPQHGTLSGTAPNLTYTPAAGYVGPDSLQYKANNGFADSNIALVSVNVFIPGSVQSVVIDNDLGQRSMVRSLTVRFSGVVSFVGAAPSAFQLARTGPGAPAGNVTLAVDLTGSTATQTIARLTFSGPLTEGPNSLIDGNYTLTVFSAQVQGGLPGGDHVTALHRYYGDVNGDRAVNGLDLGLFRGAFGTSLGNPNYLDFLDQNGDGAINGLDLAVFRTHFGTTLP